MMNAVKKTKYSGKISLDKADGYYRVGETVVCSIVLLKDRKPLAGPVARVKVRWENHDVDVREFVTDGNPFEVSFRGEKPGWVYFGVEILDENGEALRGPGVFKHRMKPTIVTEIGAMFDPDKIVSCVREPADFDEFWKKRREEVLSMRPFDPELREFDSKISGIKLFGVSLRCPRGVMATGYLAYPEKAAPASLKAGVTFQSLTYTDALRHQAVNIAKSGGIGFATSWHGFPVGKQIKYYPEFVRPYFQRGMKGIESRETWVYNDIFFRVMAELEFIKSQPLWNGKDLMVMGGSLGGIQTIFASAIDPDVSLSLVAVPSSCECNAFEAGRTPNGTFRRIPVDTLKSSPEYLETGYYFDAVNFGKRIKCETFVCTGFVDEACMPSNVYAFYNAIPDTTPKTMTTNPKTGHYNTTKDGNAAARLKEYGGDITVCLQPSDSR